MYIVSRCLLGFNCKYDGGHNRKDNIVEFCNRHDYVTVCPETAAGLEAPRQPAEIVPVDAEYFKVLSKDGQDLTEAFDKGASISLASVLLEAENRKAGDCKIEGAILKARSPSCGSGCIYDGSFTGTLTGGNGVFTDKLIEACLNERSDAGIELSARIFTEDFRICDEDNFERVFSDAER